MTDIDTRAYHGDISVELYNATAQNVIGKPEHIADHTVDMILTDPPYIISKASGFQKRDENGKGGGLKRFQNYATDFGAWDRDTFSMRDLRDVITDFNRILRPGGVVIVFFDLWKMSLLAEMLRDEGFENIAMIEWRKTNAVPINARHNYLTNSREIAIAASKPGQAPIYKTDNNTGAFDYPIYHAKDRFHPTQKSLGLFEELITCHTNPGDMVLDCFSGSATTGLAAVRTGRHYIGCEPDVDYFRQSWDRLERALEHGNTRKAG